MLNGLRYKVCGKYVYFEGTNTLRLLDRASLW